MSFFAGPYIPYERKHIIKSDGSNFYLEIRADGRKTILNNRGGYIKNRWAPEEVLRMNWLPQKVRDCALETLAEEGVLCNG